MAEFAGPVVGEAFKSALSHLEREISYLVYFRTNISSLEDNVRLLTAKRNDVKRLIEGATMNDEVTREMVEAWLQTVENILGLATKLNGKAAKIDRWFKGWIWCSRFSSSRSGQKMTETIKRLLEFADSFGEKVADERRVQDLVSLTGVLTSNGEFNTFGSRVITGNRVIQALQDDKVRLLGIYGMPGVGKSTMIRALRTYVKKHRIFDEAVIVTLTQTPEIKVIQRDIASGLGLKLEDADSLETRANRLFARLSQDRKTLLVLDNLWQEVKLSEIGIPECLENCKVVFTTRSQDVCNSMGAGESRIEIEVLSPEESWDLFRRKAGDTVDSHAFQSVARDVLNECQGLPLLIVTLGKALYGKRKTYWDAALESLRNSTLLQNPIFTVMPQVFSGMKSSYDFLESEEVKFCFLLCCLFPDGYHISMDQLFHYMMGEKMLWKASTLQAARLHLHVMVDKLISSCLLLQDNTGCVVMHDVIRDVALAIASNPREGNGFIVKAGVQLNGWPNMQLADCKRLSFITTRGNHMSWRLPYQIRAVHMLTLSFHGNERLEEIPAAFFEETPNLLAVDLSYTGIKVLPQSIMSLTKLVTLLLEGCLSLDGVNLSSTMERLEILSLRYSAIESVTVSRKMTTLKLLDLSYTSNLTHISQNIISSFTELEELYLFESFRAWEPERTEPGESSGRMPKVKHHAEKDESGETERRGDSARLSEVTSLPRLTTLELHVGNIECLFQSIPNWENLTRFRIAVGVIDNFSPFGIDDGMQMEKSMFIELRSKLVANWVKVLLGRTNFLMLKGSQSLIDLVQLDPSGEQQFFHELKVLVLSKIGPQSPNDPSPAERVFRAVKKVSKLSDSDSLNSLIPCDLLLRLQNLNKLVIMNCEYLEKLIQFGVEDQAVSKDASSSSRTNMLKFSNIPASSVFPNLAYLRVHGCAVLRYLFPMRIIRCLSQLEMLHISNCREMRMVIVHENAEDGGKADDEKAILPKLRVLSLKGLFCLSLIIQQDVHLELPVLEELTVNGCGRLQKLPFGPGSVPQLTKLVVEMFDALKWEDKHVKQRLYRLLNRLHLKGCGSLKDVELLDQWDPAGLSELRVTDYRGSILVHRSLLRRLSNLDKLEVDYCGNLETVVEFGGTNKAGDTSMGARLSSSSVFPNLTVLKVSYCHKLRYLLPMGAARDMVHLEVLHIDECDSMEMMIEYENVDADADKAILPKLEELILIDLPKLWSFVGQDILFDWPSLKTLTVDDCPDLKKLLLAPASVPKLNDFTADPRSWFDSLEWEDEGQELKSHLQNLLDRMIRVPQSTKSG